MQRVSGVSNPMAPKLADSVLRGMRAECATHPLHCLMSSYVTIAPYTLGKRGLIQGLLFERYDEMDELELANSHGETREREEAFTCESTSGVVEGEATQQETESVLAESNVLQTGFVTLPASPSGEQGTRVPDVSDLIKTAREGWHSIKQAVKVVLARHPDGLEDYVVAGKLRLPMGVAGAALDRMVEDGDGVYRTKSKYHVRVSGCHHVFSSETSLQPDSSGLCREKSRGAASSSRRKR
jgi:hypothetical protein